jgi:hypothetical protein
MPLPYSDAIVLQDSTSPEKSIVFNALGIARAAAGEPTPVILRSPASIRSGNYCFGGADESVLAGGVVGGVAEASGAAGAAL